MTLSAVALAVVTAIAVAMGLKPDALEGTGIFFTLRGTLIEPGPVSAMINLLGLLATGSIMLALNKVFSFVRSVTRLFVSAFLLLQLAHPAGLVAFNAGTLLALVTAVSIMPLFASYQDRHSQRSIFLIFTLIAAGSMFHYCFLALIPAFLLGFLNMGVFNLKGLLAMLFGLITPFWIVLGLGIASPQDFVMPHINGIWNLVWTPQVSLELVLATATAVTGITLAVMNLMTIMNYRMQTRVYNAFFVFVLITVIIALCLNYDEMTIFMPLLGLMVAVQMAHSYTLRASAMPYRYVFMLVFIGCCAALAAANMMMR